MSKRNDSEKKKKRGTCMDNQQSRLTRITSDLLRLPNRIFERMGGVSTEEEAIWSCYTCGPIAPKRYANGFVPGKCACQARMLAQEKEQQERLEQWKRQQDLQKARVKHCYTWLGKAWSDEELMMKTFQTFDVDAQPEGFDAAFLFAEKRSGNLILWSDRSWGTGKTHLAAAICQHAIEAGASCLFTTAQNLFFAFGARLDDHTGYSDLLIKAASCDVLVLDDLDKIQQTDFKQATCFELLDKRYKRRKSTVITTNARVEVTDDDIVGVSRYVGRAAASRLCDQSNGGLVVQEMNGEDYRRRN
jgi:DNA replication protein DnaC